MSNITLYQLLEAGVHLGHKSDRWNPKMFPFIYREICNIHIIDLVQTASRLNDATYYLNKLARKRYTFLFIGTKRQASSIIAKEAKRSNSFYVNYRWLGGMLTNFSTLKKRIKKLKDLEQQESENIFNLLTKKEAASRRKELSRLRRQLNGVKEMEGLPDVAIIIDQKQEITAIRECRKIGIPIVSIIDTNCDPDLIDIPIPGNDDSVNSIKLIVQALADSIIEGKSDH